jgi:hypothetical protein
VIATSWVKISKRSKGYLRVMFVQAAWVVLVKVKPARWGPRAQALDRGCQEAASSQQRAGDRAR